MPKLSGAEIKRAHEFCVQNNFADGKPHDECEMADGTCKGSLILDHIDNNPSNNPRDGSNWQLLCRSHNRRKNPGKRPRFSNKFASGMKLGYSLEGEGIKKRERLGIRGTSAELEKSERIRPQVEKWILETINKENPQQLEMDEAINSCSYLFKCNQGTVKKYIDAMTSRVGPLMMDEIDGKEVLILKGEQ